MDEKAATKAKKRPKQTPMPSGPAAADPWPPEVVWRFPPESKSGGLELRKIEALTPYARNARTHSDEQIAQLAASIDEWGLVGGIVIRDGVIAKGHGTYSAIQRLHASSKRIYPAPGKHAQPAPEPYPEGLIPVIDATGWSEAQFKAYVIADNKLAENAGWDADLLKIELQGLQELDFPIDLLGFDQDELAEATGEGSKGEGGAGGENPYTQKITAPVYQATGKCPAIEELTDETKTTELEAEIIAAGGTEGLTPEVMGFLMHAAQRHRVFDYKKIAEFYCHASPEVQDLMERSALVIIDFEKAIENGFVLMTEKMDAAYAAAYEPDSRGEEEAEKTEQEASDGDAQ